MSKLLTSIEEAIRIADLKDGMTISFHHHLRNGDKVLNTVVKAVADMGIKDIKLAASALFAVHGEIVEQIMDGTITSIDTNYMAGPIADAVSEGRLKNIATMRTHGGRPRAIIEGSLPIDVAFIAAPSSDKMGNINGVRGQASCGSLGYAFPDAQKAGKVIVITDNLVDYPNNPISIDETLVDHVLVVESIGDPAGIVSGTTSMTRDPIAHVIAQKAADAIEASGLLKEGISFQTGAGGSSLATAYYLREKMRQAGIKGSFGMGGITGFFVSMLEEGLLESLIDVQCFDLEAVESIKKNKQHLEVSSSFYASVNSKSCAVNQLDVVILGATEIDVNFNVNVATDSNGRIMGGSGGHSDTAEGAKLTIIVSNLLRSRLPIVVEKVTTKVTPGETVDVLVTERGIAVNPLRTDLVESFRQAGLQVLDIRELKSMAEAIAGHPAKLNTSDRVVAEVEYRNGEIIDRIYAIE
jgi:citrate lyase subunit alpha/citrate CoA-transferase